MKGLQRTHQDVPGQRARATSNLVDSQRPLLPPLLLLALPLLLLWLLLLLCVVLCEVPRNGRAIVWLEDLHRGEPGDLLGTMEVQRTLEVSWAALSPVAYLLSHTAP